MQIALKLVVVVMVILIVALLVLVVFTGGIGNFNLFTGGLDCKARCDAQCINFPVGSQIQIQGCSEYSCECKSSSQSGIELVDEYTDQTPDW